MSNDSRNDDFPTIRLDDEDRRDYQQKKRPAGHSAKADNQPTGAASSNSVAAGNSSSGTIWAVLALLIALGGCGGCYYLYSQLLLQQAEAEKAENRIAQLERKLSATGEEMGESTVALQVKVGELTDKSNELWDQMDKLWASAWRRNQKEITELGDKLNSTQTELKKSVSGMSEDIKAQQSKLASLNNQLSGIADEILALNVQIEQAAGDKNAQAQTVKNLTDKLSVLENRSGSLANQISSLRDDMRELATKVASQPDPTGV
ncbi:hypothetical protein [Aestuariibacter sp. A3R04]|uniref:hypothetical protein n=1 Tax=Aestuariibacter sp. A3R04 TaxID=2841571 RepID=UPI001C090D87|nr:hypothetical protein [Aestuariibacter sp. A3R04]MBU3023174.1 hypothetical protein [Aestuariibacter sp. A3R04]